MLARLRLGHTGLRSTLFMMARCATELCEVCNVPETVEHVLLRCSRYLRERAILRSRLSELGQGWSLPGILGSGMNVRDSGRALFAFLRATGLDCRI